MIDSDSQLEALETRSRGELDLADDRPERLKKASSKAVRKVLLASAARPRNVAVMTTSAMSAVILIGMGMSIPGLALLGIGTLGYLSLIGMDALNNNFLQTVFSFGDEEADAEAESESVEESPLELHEIDGKLRGVYESIQARQEKLEGLLCMGPPVVKASLPEANRICVALLGHARRLVRRGQRLQSYLDNNRLADLSDSACSAVLLVEQTNDLVASSTYRQVVAGKQRHMETHIEVEGLLDRVLAQLLLIETMLATAIAKLVKITAADDEESSLTASLVHEQLEMLMGDVRILETSLDEASEVGIYALDSQH